MAPSSVTSRELNEGRIYRLTLQRAVAAIAGAAVLAVMSACDATFGLGLPATRALENGAAGTLGAAKTFEITGSYTDAADHWSIDLQVARPSTQHMVVRAGTIKLEAIVFGNDAYFRGQQFLSQHMGNDAPSQSLARAAGNAWWKGSSGDVPRLPDLTDGTSFRSTFLGSAVTQRSDHVSVDGIDAVDLSGPRAEVFIAATPPYQLLRLVMKKSVVIDGIREGDLRFSNYNREFAIAAPAGVIDFSNLSTLPPIYTVLSVDTSACGSPCAVSASLKNLGGMKGARAPSTITFAMTAATSGKVVGSCQRQVQPDVGYNATTTAGCTIDLNGRQENAATVTATADNPGHG